MNKEEKKEAWEIAFSLADVDELKPSQDLLLLAEKEVNGEITKEEILEILKEKYQVKD